jgi:hypothetical protein
VWESEEFGTYMSTAVYLDGYFYRVHGHYGIIKWCTLRCVDAETGELMWQEKTGGASLCAADGILRIVETTPEAYTEISSCELPVKRIPKWWTMPVLCGGKIYCRNYYGDLVCIDVSE